ncbi:MAG TPA: flagellar type III secretion system pore protein FliP [Angustibacter sp.]|nr:flagellar type III secretion system pore protein FliP [Angustibacter sp.]
MSSRARAAAVALLAAIVCALGLALASPASAAAPPSTSVVAVSTPKPPTSPVQPSAPAAGGVSIQIGGTGADGQKPSSSIVIILAITALSVAPALLLLTTSFTKIFVVLGITRNALGLQTTPPTQVLAGLALFLTLFVMSPVLTKVNHDGIQPYLKGDLTQSQAFDAGSKPLKSFMVSKTRPEELALITKAAKLPKPKNAASVPLTTLVPAFVLSELRSAFVIGFLVFVPFLIIDLVVSAALMSLGMMMLPPVTVSLPFKLLLFVLVDGWGLIVQSLVASYR